MKDFSIFNEFLLESCLFVFDLLLDHLLVDKVDHFDKILQHYWVRL